MKTAVSDAMTFVPVMIPPFAPLWAELFGEDEFGVFTEFELNRVRFVWRWIPPGRFLMGSPPEEIGRYDDEGPQHWVTITSGFWLGETPVTQAQWLSLMDDNPASFKGNELPVESVNWHQCMAFTEKLSEQVPGLSASLPTEAQWEFACRAGTQGAFHVEGFKFSMPEGLDPVLDRLGWFGKNSQRQTHEVKLKSPNEHGLYDMHGNVWEWCRDGMRAYGDMPEHDPVGPTEANAGRVVRGGSWGRLAKLCRAAYRNDYNLDFDWDYFGFRLFAGQELVLGAEQPVP